MEREGEAAHRFSFWRPQSMTKLTSSMVIDVSAMFVASTTCERPHHVCTERGRAGRAARGLTLRTPGGGRSKTRRWSSGGMAECSGSTHERAGSTAYSGVACSEGRDEEGRRRERW